jgi:hypothetical protein
MFGSSKVLKKFRTSMLNSSQALSIQKDSEQSSEASDLQSTMSEIDDFDRLISMSLQNAELNFNNAQLTRFSCEDIIDGLSDLPHNTHTINLEGNALNQFSIDDLEAIFAALPHSLLSLNLANTSLNKIPAQHFERIFGLVSPKLQHLNLNDNNLGEIENIDAIVKALKTLPQTLQSIQLDGNMLGLTCKKDNQNIVSALPTSIQTLSLKNNIYQNWKDKDFTQVLMQMPASLKKVEINHNYLGLRHPLSKQQTVLKDLLKKQLVIKELLLIPKSFCLCVEDGGEPQNYDIKAYRREIYQQSYQDIERFLRRKLTKDCRKKLNDFLNLVNKMYQNGYDQGQLAIALTDTRDFLQEKISYLAYVKRCKMYQGSTDIFYKQLGNLMMILGAAIFAAGIVLATIPASSIMLGVGTGVGGLTLSLGSYGLFKNTGLAKASEDLAREYVKIFKVEP